MDKHRRKAGGGALKGLGAAFLVISSAAVARGDSGPGIASAAAASSAWHIDRWNPHIAEASERFGIPEDWIRRVMRAESGGRTLFDGRPITSRAGAVGLMQLMPGTWAEVRAKHGLGPDPHQPRDNAAYLRAMYDRFGYPGLFAAYNSGPARYAEHLASGRRLPAETVAYVAAVGSDPRRAAANVRTELRQFGIFVSLRNVRSGDIRTHPSPAAPSVLFVRLSTASAAIE